MPVSRLLSRKLQEVLGAEAAESLVTILEDMDAQRGDLNELRHEMQLGFARIDAQFEQVNVRFEQQDALFERALRDQTRFFFVAWSVILAGMIAIYAR